LGAQRPRREDEKGEQKVFHSQNLAQKSGKKLAVCGDTNATFAAQSLCMNTDLVTYYRDRAAEYEQVFVKPERQRDLARLKAILQDIFRDKHLLEIACGTGYWTERIAQTAGSILATDINQTVLDLAAGKNYPKINVTFRREDVFQHPDDDQQFEGLFGGFIWSHILLEQLDAFLTNAARRVMPGGVLVFVDNRFVPGNSLPISHTDAAGNTWQTRYLEDGSEHLVLKNFPTQAFLLEKLEGVAGVEQVDFFEFEYYWMAVGRMG
jgi:demethylmenaquinone methyltransferase/2-methoxy-6-polyprenyl-1,4-benzoquinol methylase